MPPKCRATHAVSSRLRLRLERRAVGGGPGGGKLPLDSQLVAAPDPSRKSRCGRRGLGAKVRYILSSSPRALRPMRDYRDSLRHFTRGLRYAERVSAPTVPLPAVRAEAAENPLEAYFDAHSEGRGLFKWRHYFDVYHRHLQRFRGRPVHVLEIGVLGGGSLEMWRAYLGPDARLTGVDVDPECTALAPEGTEILIGDQGDPDFWQSYLATSPAIDVVIDDGGHRPAQQAVTLESLLPRINPGGVYICEDIHHQWHPFHAFLDGLTRPLNAVGGPYRDEPASPLQQHVASVHRYPLVVVIEKPSALPVFQASRHGSVWPNRVRKLAARDQAKERGAPAGG